MSLPLLLIIVSTVAGLLALWKDDLLKESRSIHEEETAMERSARIKEELKDLKAKKIKYYSSAFILLTLIFTIFKIYGDKIASDKALVEKNNQHRIDWLRYRKDSLAHVAIDSIRKLQLQVKTAQIQAGKTIDDIKSKSTDIMSNLSGVDTAIKKSIKKIDLSSFKASAAFDKLLTSSRRLLFMLDSNISIQISFGFFSPKTEQKIEQYLKANHLTGEYINVDEDFPYYQSLQEVFKNASIEIAFFDNNNPAKVIDRDNKIMKDVFSISSVVQLSNKEPLVFWPYRDYSDKHLLTTVIFPPGVFEMLYHTPSKSFYFTCNHLDLILAGRQKKYSSILDLDKTAMLLTIKTPEVRDNKQCFFNLLDSYVNYTINFSNKSNTDYQVQLRPLSFYAGRFWPRFFVDTVRLRLE